MEQYKYSSEQIIWLKPEGEKDAILSTAVIPQETGGYELFSTPSYKYDCTAYSLTPGTLLRLNQAALLSDTLFVLLMLILLFAVVFIFVSKGLVKPMLKAQYEAKIRADEAKYKALQAQVNPHFLYNTLDTMSGVATSQGSTDVSNLCRALSNIFRYSLDMERPYTTLENELLHIKNYMYIMNVRMNNSISLKFDIEEFLLGEQVLRLSIQPLVENAVNHGLKNKRGEKEIVIGASRSGDMLTVYVQDNGTGMDAKAVNERMKASVADALNKSSSIGLDNINARIKLIYGDEYGLTVQSGGAGSRVSMNTPASLKEDPADG